VRYSIKSFRIVLCAKGFIRWYDTESLRPNNPFEEYRAFIDAHPKFAGKQKYYLVLAPYDPNVPRWKWVDYRDFINIYMFGSGSSLPPRGFLNGSLFLREFLMNIEDELGASMNDQDFEFVQENYPSFVDAVALRYQRRKTG